MSIILTNQTQMPYRFPESALSANQQRDESQNGHTILVENVLKGIANCSEPYELYMLSIVSVRAYKVTRYFQEKFFNLRKNNFNHEINELNKFILTRSCLPHTALRVFSTLDPKVQKTVETQKTATPSWTNEDIMTEPYPYLNLPEFAAAETVRKDREKKLSGLFHVLTIDDFVHFVTANPEESPMTFFHALSPVDQKTVTNKILSSSITINPYSDNQFLEEQIRKNTEFFQNAINAFKQEKAQ
jgi:hypothetical protein